jgi:hypothetical protein
VPMKGLGEHETWCFPEPPPLQHLQPCLAVPCLLSPLLLLPPVLHPHSCPAFPAAVVSPAFPAYHPPPPHAHRHSGSHALSPFPSSFLF